MSISPYAVAFVVLAVLLLKFIVEAVRNFERRNFEKMFAYIGWAFWIVGIIWIGAFLMELSDQLILSSYTNVSYAAFLAPFVIGALSMAISGALISRRVFSGWREDERDRAALPQVESLRTGDLPVSPRH